MSRRPQRVRGTQDIWGEDADRFRTVVETFDRVRRLYAFERVELPVFEATEVFARSIGEVTDIVAKEMYTFPDRGGESLTLRPEFTAGICRAFISEGWQQRIPLKLATDGPIFRYERPQKGRYRQFHQLDAEIIGSDSPLADVEVIALGAQLLRELGIADKCELQLNTLGDEATRDAWRAALVAHFRSGDLSEESRRRLERNPLRILDSKEPQDKPLIDSAPAVDDNLTNEAGDFFAQVTRGLDAAGIDWVRNPRLVRGMDYYRHTAFEFLGADLGAQNAVIAGGRYDGLIADIGGPPTPAVGWAAGIERLGMMLASPQSSQPEAVLVPLGETAETAALSLLTMLRAAGIACDMAFKGNLKKRMAGAATAGARYALLIGEEELASGTVAVKDLASGEQRSIAQANVVDELRRR